MEQKRKNRREICFSLFLWLFSCHSSVLLPKWNQTSSVSLQLEIRISLVTFSFWQWLRKAVLMRFHSEKPCSVVMLETGMMQTTFANVAQNIEYNSLQSWIKTLKTVRKVKAPRQQSAVITRMASCYIIVASTKGVADTLC